MKLFVKSFAAVFFLLGSFLSPVSAKSDSLSTSTFKNCSRLNKVYPSGVAVSASKARIQEVRPTVSRTVYNRNKKLDRDKDGTVCEVARPRNTPSTSIPFQQQTTFQVVPLVPSVPPIATTTVPVVCPNSSNVSANILSASDGSYRTTGISVIRFYFMRNVQGFVRNNSGVRVHVFGFSLAGNLLKGSEVMETQSVPVFNNVILEPNGVHGWSSTYETLGARSTWSDYSTVVRSETVGSLSFVSLDSRCP